MERLIDLAARRHGFDRLDAAPPEPRARRAPCRIATPLGVLYDSGDYRGGAGPRGGARRLGGVRGAPGRGAPARPLSRHRRRQLHRAQYRRSARARAHHGAARGPGRRGARHAVVRPGTRDELRRSCSSSGSAWRSTEVRLITGDTDRHRHRRRRAFRPRAAAGRGRDGQGVGSDRRQGPADRRLAAGGGGGRHRVLGAALPREGHRPRGRPLRGRRRRARPDAPADSRPLDGVSDETMTRAVLSLRLRGVRGRGRSRDRAWWTSCATRPWTTCGRAVNPMILHGQTHGGIAQGVGQALWESAHYDAETGPAPPPR